MKCAGRYGKYSCHLVKNQNYVALKKVRDIIFLASRKECVKLKINFVISQAKHILQVLNRTVSLRQLFVISQAKHILQYSTELSH